MPAAGSRSRTERAGHRRRVRRLLAVVLAPLAVLTVAGLVVLWPSGARPAVPQQYRSPDGGRVVIVDATVENAVRGPCGGVVHTGAGAAQLNSACVELSVRFTSGPDSGTSRTIEQSYDPTQPVLKAGDKVRMGGNADSAKDRAYYVYDFQRSTPMVWIGLLFAVAVVAVARWRGLAALVGVVVTYLVLVYFLLPALLQGRSPVGVALTATAALLFVVLYLAHGPSIRTTTALVGTLVSLGLTGLLAAASIAATRLTGLGSDDVATLKSTAGQISLTGLLLAGLLVASVGLLNDVTVTQASAVWELAELSPEAGPARLFRAGMRVGRDHIASSIYTVVLVYAGAALPTLLLLTLSQRSGFDVLTGDLVAAEVVRALVSGIGLVASVPVTTAVAAYVVTR